MLTFSRAHSSPEIQLVRVGPGGYGDESGQSESRISARGSGRQAMLPMDLILSKPVRRVCWMIILGVQLLHVVVLAGLAFLYSQLNTRDSLFWLFSTVYLFSDANAFLDAYYVPIAASYAFFAAVFGLLLCETLFYSCRYRQLAYGRRKQAWRGKSTRSTGCCARPLNYAKQLLSSWNRRFGIRGRYFAVGLMTQEMVEIALQTSQAHASSKFVSNLVLNQSYGLLICGNCMSTIAVHWWLREDSIFARLVCVLIDLVLDFVWGAVLPFVLFYPRIAEYYRDDDTNKNTTSAELVREEIEHLLILSATNCMWSFFPFLSTAWNIIKLRRLLAQSTPLDDASMRNSKAIAQRRQTARVLSWQKQLTLAKLLPKIQRYFNALVFLYGIFILCVSIHASGVFRKAEETPFLCVHQVYPWFASRKSCSMRQINCAEASIVGTSGEITAATDFFNADSLTNMAIQSCPELEIPPALHQFAHLRILTIVASVVKAWPANASVVLMSALVTLKLYNLEFESVPFGILEQPESMEWVSVFETDVSQFAPFIGSGWRAVKYLYCGSCGLTSIPDFMYEMSNLLELSACNNSIAYLPAEFFAGRPMTILFFDGNPFKSLPSTLWQPSLFDLYIQDTDVSELSPWKADDVGSNLIAHAPGSPLCEGEYLQEKYPSIADRFICDEEELLFG